MKNIIYLVTVITFSFSSFSCSARQAKKEAIEQQEVVDTLIQEEVVIEGAVVEEVAKATPTPKEESATKGAPTSAPKTKEKPEDTPKPEEKAELVQEEEKAVAPKEAQPVEQEVPEVVEPIVITFPVGSVLPIKLASTLATDGIQTGAKFSGSIQMDVISDAGDVLPEGAKVQGKVISFKNGGRLAGQSELILELTHIKLGEKYHAIATEQLVMQGEKSGKKTLRNAGVGAAVGAAIDGGSGAGKGAAVMGGLQLLTNKGALSVPAGFALNFTLAKDLSFEK